MKGKTCIVTGANAGIGYMTALGIAEKGAQVVMVCRNEQKGITARDEIRDKSGNSDVHLLACDMASQVAIRACAEKFRLEYGRLDLLINNAGIVMGGYETSPEGIEMQFAVNHLGYFLFTNLLLDLLKAHTPARIVNVSSASHYNGKIDFDSFNNPPKGRYKTFVAYGQSKLANVLFTYELARKLQGSNVTANCLHPGVVRTDIGNKKVNGFMRFMWSLMKPFMLPPEKGAATSLHVATASELEGVSGKFFSNSKEKKSSKLSYDKDLAGKLWEVSEAMTGLSDAEKG